jgi:hypothetical protein
MGLFLHYFSQNAAVAKKNCSIFQHGRAVAKKHGLDAMELKIFH